MKSFQRVGQCAVILVAAIALTACASKKEAAQRLIGAIESTVAATSTEAETYTPGPLSEVKYKLGRLKLSFDKQDYAAVVTGAPAVLTAAQGLASAAAAEKERIIKTLNDEWTELAGSLPRDLSAIQNRIIVLSGKSNGKQTMGADLGAATTDAGSAASLWSQARAAFTAGNLDEAVSDAKDVREKVDAVASSLKLNLRAAPQ
jgi:hypothetical protein